MKEVRSGSDAQERIRFSGLGVDTCSSFCASGQFPGDKYSRHMSAEARDSNTISKGARGNAVQDESSALDCKQISHDKNMM